MLKVLNTFKIKFFFVHHYGGTVDNPYAKTGDTPLENIENAHRSRAFPVSKLGSHIGYTAIILRNGKLVQNRLVGESTAAVRFHNDISISVCLAGNFTINPRTGQPVEKPTSEQIETLRKLEEWAWDRVKLPLRAFIPHRVVAKTQCYGTVLKNDFAMNLLIPMISRRITRIGFLILKYYSIMLSKVDTPLGKMSVNEVEYECIGHI